MYCKPHIRQQTTPEEQVWILFPWISDYCSHMSVCVHSLLHSNKNSVLADIQECLFSDCEAKTCVLQSQKDFKTLKTLQIKFMMFIKKSWKINFNICHKIISASVRCGWMLNEIIFSSDCNIRWGAALVLKTFWDGWSATF